jgi:hypothetical protein
MKRKLITGLVVALLVFGVQMSFVAESFPGFHSNADCRTCHSYYANVYNETLMDSSVTVDGMADEAMWADGNTYGRTIEVPVGSTSNPREIVFLLVTFGQNSTHFFIRVDWADPTINGTDQKGYEDSDGISFMFNIDNPNFDSGYGMDRAPGDTKVDVVTWKPGASMTGTQDLEAETPIAITSDNLYDQHITDDSRNDDETNEWTWAAVHGNVASHHEENYQLEMARPLTTDDEFDVQFDEPAYTEFAVILFNSTSGADHMVSPPYIMWVGPPADMTPVTETVVSTVTESPVSLAFMILGLFSVPAAIVLLRRK